MKLEIAAYLIACLPHVRPSRAHQPPTPAGPLLPREALAPALDRCGAVDIVPAAPDVGHPAPAGGRARARSKPPPGPPLAPRIAAKRFVAWMQEHDFTGELPWGGAGGIWAFYGWHCHEANVQPVPDNMFAAALERVVLRRQVRDRSTGKLRRFTYYVIPALPEVEARAAARAPGARSAPEGALKKRAA